MKSSLTLIIGLLLSISVLAQGKWVIGPVASLGFSGERMKNIDEYANRSGSSSRLKESKVLPSFGGGFFAERYLGKHWSIGLGLEYNYVQRFDRTEYAYYGTLGNLTSYNNDRKKLVSHQLQAPLQTRFYLGKKDKIRPYLSFGGLVTYAFTATQTVYSSYSSSNSTKVEIPFTENYDLSSEYSPLRRFSISAFYGIGIDFKSFAIELDRFQSVLNEKHDYYDYRFSYNSFVDIDYIGSPRQTHLTRMLVRYKF